jgi:GT2 family glycosyltransferase
MLEHISKTHGAQKSCFLSVSVVTYHTDWITVKRCLDSLITACDLIADRKSFLIYLVDNSSAKYSESLSSSLSQHYPHVKMLFGHGNVGYGRANNIALFASDSEFHLILNPDAFLDVLALRNGLDYLVDDTSAVLVAACGFSEEGEFLYLAKREPSVLTLALRGFAPKRVQSVFKERLSQYEMRDRNWAIAPIQIEYASGAFMLCRTVILKRINGFDPKYFLYFEDFELCRRLRRFGRLIQVPSVRLVHLGGSTSAKGYKHIKYFLESALRFKLSRLG